MFVAKLSTILFGIGTIIVALMVPSVGGIVNVVLVGPLQAVPIRAYNLVYFF